MRSRTTYVDLAAAFPKDSTMAKLAARALVLWADLQFERDGFEAKDLGPLDKLGEVTRKTFFFRSNLRTLYSAHKLFQAVRADNGFKARFAQAPEVAAEFDRAKKEIDRTSELWGRLRNAIGGHAENDVGDAIVLFDPGNRAPIELHSEDKLRPRLVSHIWLATILSAYCDVRHIQPPTTAAETAQTFNDCIGEVAVLVESLVKALSIMIGLYSQGHPLFGRD